MYLLMSQEYVELENHHLHSGLNQTRLHIDLGQSQSKIRGNILSKQKNFDNGIAAKKGLLFYSYPSHIDFEFQVACYMFTESRSFNLIANVML